MVIASSSVDSKRKSEDLHKTGSDDIANLGLRKQDVFINLVEVPKENWLFGNGEMQYGPQ